MRKKEKQEAVQPTQMQTRVEKGKSGIISIIFGRTGVIILLLILQIGFLMAGYTYLQGKMYFIDTFLRIVAVILVIYLTNNRTNPAFKMVWMTIIMVVPVFGTLLYLFVETQIGVRWLNARLQHMHEMTRHYWTQNKEVHDKLEQENAQTAALATSPEEWPPIPSQRIKSLSSPEASPSAGKMESSWLLRCPSS